MAKIALEGRYQGEIVGLTLGEIGDKGSVAIEVEVKPSAELVGADWVAGEYPKVRKPFWLGDTIGKSGKTSLEVSRVQLKETFGYAGDLTEEALKAGILGKKVEISCMANEKGYTEVKYIDPAGGGGKGLKRLKPITEDKLAKLAALWKGEAPVEKAIDPATLFASMTAKIEGAA